MDGRKGQKGKLFVLSGLMAAVLLVGIPSCSADVFGGTRAATSPRKPRALPLSSFSVPASSSASTSKSIGGKRRQSSFSSVVFRVQGNVYPLGIYYVSINIGNPPKPYFLDVDTGSDVTWLQCDAPCSSCSKSPHPLYRPVKNRLVPCNDRLCQAVHESTQHEGGCEMPHDQCDYDIEYQDNGSSIGVLVTDTFALPLSNKTLAYPSLAFGCGYDQHGWPSNTDGVLGLGSGEIGILSQLRDLGVCRSVVGHCLSRNSQSFLFIGDNVVPPRGMTWVPMSSVAAKYYSPGLATVFAGKQKLADKQTLVFDSGSSYTYFSKQMYQSLLSLIRSDISKTSLKEAPEEKALPLCWKDAKPFSSVLELRKYFRSIILSFGKGKAMAQMVIPPENYFIVTEKGRACLGILNGSDLGLEDLNLIGDISMQDTMIVYDNENKRIGWAAAGCDRLIIAEEDEVGFQFQEGILYQLQFPGIGVHQEYLAY
ncbi:aspartic proteinase Asp1 [Dendrobium catenatum]|uniref:aspartic proteinase Asp1 n=1 Tax=Dendrobium catenatum TaxID=906689 RepID=UPI0009F399D4|nr:aspartic proteinase Asp1 [Dendrobium catenatum]